MLVNCFETYCMNDGQITNFKKTKKGKNLSHASKKYLVITLLDFWRIFLEKNETEFWHAILHPLKKKRTKKKVTRKEKGKKKKKKRTRCYEGQIWIRNLDLNRVLSFKLQILSTKNVILCNWKPINSWTICYYGDNLP